MSVVECATRQPPFLRARTWSFGKNIARGILDRNSRVGSWTRCVLQSRNDSIQPFHGQAALVELCLPGSAGGQSVLTRVGVYLPDLRATLLAALFPVLPGRLVGPLALLLTANSGMSLLAMGDPSPVHGSHP